MNYVIVAKVANTEKIFYFLMLSTNRFQQSKCQNHKLEQSLPKAWAKFSVRPRVVIISLLFEWS